MKFDRPLIPATLIRRYKRFLADVILEDGRELTVHTANTGAMTGCAAPQSKIWLYDTQNPSRKYPLSWEISTSPTGSLIGVNTHMANKLVSEAINNDVIAELQGYSRMRTEVKYGNENSRIDLLLGHDFRVACYVEVKSVTLLREPSLVEFPDAVSARGSKHLRELMCVRQEGNRAVLVFCIQRNDATRMQAAADIDPAYAKTLQLAYAMGVEILAYEVDISRHSITISRRVPFTI